MTTSRYIFFILLCVSSGGLAAPHEKLAISLSYDDALPSQLSHAVPALNARGFKATFYLVPENEGVTPAWKAVAQAGHELGNHTLTHPCRSDKANREWVTKDNDLARITVSDMVAQVKKTNQILSELDNQPSRTLTPPCGDTDAADGNYLEASKALVTAIKGYDLDSGTEAVWAPDGVSGQALIAFIESQPESVKIVSLIFHGIGGDYLTVSEDAHTVLLDYLAKHSLRYDVDTYQAIRERYAQSLEK